MHATTATIAPPRGVKTHRLTLPDGAVTSLHVARHPRATTAARVVRLARPQPLLQWARHHGIRDALVGGFYARPHGDPLGELWIDGRRLPSVPFEAPFDARRACVDVSARGVSIDRRDALPVLPARDRLQAGPLLLRNGAYAAAGDPEGFGAGAGQFDSDITAGRYPRAALGLTDHELLAVACDGRADDEAGLTFPELARALRELGAHTAINLDGGGSASLVAAGELVNTPREQHGITLLQGRAVTTAIVFTSL